MSHRMECHIDDNVQDPEDAQGPDFAEYQEDFANERQARTDERRGIQLQVSTTIVYISQHSSFDHIELIGLLKRISRYLADEI